MSAVTFPPGFLWGAATAALQIEGAAMADGRGPSQWDTFCAQHPECIHERATPAIACDHYHRWSEDVAWMARLGHNAYRCSISWSRLLPEGTGPLNEPGVRFYAQLFAALRAARITPLVTLYHWDLPQPLADAGGWENPATLAAFVEYAKTCHTLYGHHVTDWVTINEAAWTTLQGYVTGLHPPNRRSDYRAAMQVATHFLIAHARVAAALHARQPEARVGMAMNLSPVYPTTDNDNDRQAAAIADGFFNRWFLEPLLLGRFPADVVALLEKHGLQPTIPAADRVLLAAPSLDFAGVNYYYPHHVSAAADATEYHLNTSGRRDEACKFAIAGLFRFVANPRGRYTEWAWEVHPEGLTELCCRIHDLAPTLPIYVTENGIGRQEELIDGTVDDTERIEFVRAHLVALHRAIAAGANVRGYFMWSLLDNFSWINGFKKRYGFLFVDRQTQNRYAKRSAWWFRDVIRHNGFINTL